jgi:hypothetical protein
MKFIKIIVVFFFPLIVFSQKENLDFILTTKLQKDKEIKLIYNDAHVDVSDDDQYSHILTNKLIKDLIKNDFKVIFPQELKNICANCSNMNDFKKDNKYIYFYIETQNSGGRTTINGVIYQENGIIGSFTSYRSYWTNKRFDDLSESIVEKLRIN